MDLALIFSLILALGIGAQWLAWYLKQPSILLLLIIGIVAGPITGVVNPDVLLGDWLFPVVSLGVAVILFEGAMTLEFHEIKNHGQMVMRLVTTAVLITVAIAALAAYWLFDMDKRIALLFGTLVCVTGPTVIVPMLRSVRPNADISNILRWEGILIDPIGALLVVLVYAYIAADDGSRPFMVFLNTLFVGLVIGALAALVLVFLIKRYLIPDYLKNVFTLSWVLLVFSLSNALMHESGLVTVTVMGIVLANWKKFPKDEILHFKESLSVILISVLFIILAARIQLDGFVLMGWKGLLVLLIIMFIARPLGVFSAAIGSKLTRNEKLLICWIAPRGIVAAAVSSLFVLRLEARDLEGTALLVPLVFTVIIGTVLIQSLGAKPIATFLNVREPIPNGVMIAGGSDFAIALGESLKENGFSVLIADARFESIKKARMLGIETYYGNPVSEHAERHLSLIGMGSLLAMSTRPDANILATLKYRHEFGEENIYRLRINTQQGESDKNKTAEGFQSPWLFSDKISFGQLSGLLTRGAVIRTTRLSNDFDFEAYKAEKANMKQKFLPLYAISPQGALWIYSSREEPKLTSGWKLAALVSQEDK